MRAMSCQTSSQRLRLRFTKQMRGQRGREGETGERQSFPDLGEQKRGDKAGEKQLYLFRRGEEKCFVFLSKIWGRTKRGGGVRLVRNSFLFSDCLGATLGGEKQCCQMCINLSAQTQKSTSGRVGRFLEQHTYCTERKVVHYRWHPPEGMQVRCMVPTCKV